MAEILKFPYDACRRVHSQKPRRSKNGTPEERAAKAAGPQLLVDGISTTETPVDGRKLRASPLRGKVATVSLGVTVVGQMRTAELKGRALVEIAPETKKEWLQLLRDAEDAVRDVAIGLEKAVETLANVPHVMSKEEFAAAVADLSPWQRQMVSDEIDRLLAARAAKLEHDQ